MCGLNVQFKEKYFQIKIVSSLSLNYKIHTYLVLVSPLHDKDWGLLQKNVLSTGGKSQTFHQIGARDRFYYLNPLQPFIIVTPKTVAYRLHHISWEIDEKTHSFQNESNDTSFIEIGAVLPFVVQYNVMRHTYAIVNSLIYSLLISVR